jgi:hypothetical protein
LIWNVRAMSTNKLYVSIYIFFLFHSLVPFPLDIYDFMTGEAFLYKVEQYPHRLVQWSTAVTDISESVVFVCFIFVLIFLQASFVNIFKKISLERTVRYYRALFSVHSTVSNFDEYIKPWCILASFSHNLFPIWKQRYLLIFQRMF